MDCKISSKLTKNMLKRTYIYFWLTGIVFLLYNIKYPNGHLNWNVHSHIDLDIQKQQSNNQSLLFLKVISFFLVIGALYWFIEKLKIELRKTLTQIHVYITLGFTWLICILIFYSFYFPNKFMRLLHNSIFECIMNIFILLVIITQVIFLINIAFGIKKKRNNR